MKEQSFKSFDQYGSKSTRSIKTIAKQEIAESSKENTKVFSFVDNSKYAIKKQFSLETFSDERTMTRCTSLTNTTDPRKTNTDLAVNELACVASTSSLQDVGS